jgi:hypothetical protein
MLNRGGENGYPCLIPDFRGNYFSFSPSSMMFAIGLLYKTFILLKYIASSTSFLRAFIMKLCWILLKAFLAFIEMIKLSLLLLICCITFINLCILKHPYIPGMKLTWSWWMNFLICCWI